jgi:hypothetical protein
MAHVVTAAAGRGQVREHVQLQHAAALVQPSAHDYVAPLSACTSMYLPLCLTFCIATCLLTVFHPNLPTSLHACWFMLSQTHPKSAAVKPFQVTMMGHVLLFSTEVRRLQREVADRGNPVWFTSERHRPAWFADPAR